MSRAFAAVPFLALAISACGAPPPPTAPAPVASSTAAPPAVMVPVDPPKPTPPKPVVATSSTCSLGWASEPLWSPLDPALGDPDAPVTIVMFGDLQDPFTARVTPTLRELMAQFGRDKLRLVFRHNPLPFHPNAKPAAIAAQLVFDREGTLPFFQFVDLALESPKSLDQAGLVRFAREVGVRDLQSFEASLTDAAITARIDRTIELAGALELNGTPGFLINGRPLMGAQPLQAFRSAVTAALAEAGAGGDRACAMARANAPTRPKPPSPPPPSGNVEDELAVFRVPITGSPSRGGTQPLVTIVMFGGYQDPFSKRAETTLQELMTKYGGDLRIVWKDKPLPFHKNAMPSASLARQALAQQGVRGFWLAYKKLMDATALDQADLDRIATELGLSPRNVKAVFAAGTHKAAIDTDTKLGDDLQVSGTPSFFVNGRKLVGAQPKATFEKLIDEQLEAAKKRIAGGAPRAGLYEVIVANGKVPGPKHLGVSPRRRTRSPPEPRENPCAT